jgi:hypothetical protein
MFNVNMGVDPASMAGGALIQKHPVVPVSMIPGAILGTSVALAGFTLATGIYLNSSADEQPPDGPQPQPPVQKTNPFVLLGMGLLFPTLIGLFAGAGLYNLQWKLANPQLAAEIQAARYASSAIRGPFGRYS